MLVISMQSKGSIDNSFEIAIFEQRWQFLAFSNVFKILYFSVECAYITELATEIEYFRGSHSCLVSWVFPWYMWFQATPLIKRTKTIQVRTWQRLPTVDMTKPIMFKQLVFSRSQIYRFCKANPYLMFLSHSIPLHIDHVSTWTHWSTTPWYQEKMKTKVFCPCKAHG